MQATHLLASGGLPAPLVPAADMPSIWSNTKTSFDDAAELFVKRHRADGASRDRPVADLRTWGLRAHGGRFALQPIGQHHEPLVLRETGLANLCARLHVPIDFFRRLPAPLQLATMNWALSDLRRSTSVVLRTRDDQVQAIVSERYAALDADELITTLRQVLVQHALLDGVRVRAVATGTTDALRITFPERAIEAKVGDVAHVGLDITSSSFGRSSLHVRGLLYRLVCTNGMRLPEKMGDFSARHVGDAQRLRDFLADAVPAAMAHTNGLLESWRHAVAVEIERVAEFIDSIRELTTTERELVSQNVRLEAGVPELPETTSLYGMVNSLTATARDVETARRLELETIAGKLLIEQAART